jgi:hypothetical protein
MPLFGIGGATSPSFDFILFPSYHISSNQTTYFKHVHDDVKHWKLTIWFIENVGMIKKKKAWSRGHLLN